MGVSVGLDLWCESGHVNWQVGINELSGGGCVTGMAPVEMAIG